MTMTLGESIITIIMVIIATVITRFLPFIIFPDNKTPPRYIQYLGKVLPSAIMGLLIVYCLKDINILSGSHGLPEFISILCITVFYMWKKNTVLSILLGTIIYMVLVQLVFV